MSESAALQAARKGRAALEAFQRAHPEDTLDFSGVDFRDPQNEHIQFPDFEFLLKVDFKEAKFGGDPSGRRSQEGAALFQKTVFHRHASFANATFGNEVRFDDSIFKVGASFSGTTFGDNARFSRAVFQNVSFSRSILGAYACFDDILVIEDCSFEEMIFGNKAQFCRAFFERAHFQSSLFGEDANFEYAVFSALAQFNNTEFGAGACFRGVAFCSRAGFEESIFGGHASFRGIERQILVDIADERAKSLPPDYAKIVKDRVRLADSSVFLRASFYGATFTSEAHRYATVFSQAKGAKSKIVEGLREFARLIRVLFYPVNAVMRSGSAGVDFSNRSIKGLADFSQVRFDQPPDFQNVEPATSLSLTEARFSFRSMAWPWLRYWTTLTETVTRLRRLRKIAKDIEETDLERSLFILQRMAERGVAWSVWWGNVLHGWGIYHLINAHLKNRKATEISHLKRRWPLKLARSVWVAITGIGHPFMLTFLVFIYRYLSDFGRSIVLPIVWAVLFLFGSAYWYSLYTPALCHAERISDLIAFSFYNSFPFSPIAKINFEDIALRLFPAGIPTEVLAISIGQTIVESLLLFLMALALRNHFRVQ